MKTKAKYSRVLLQCLVTKDYWCGQFGWFHRKCKALPMTDEEASIRINIEVQCGSPVTAFKAERIWVNEDNDIVSDDAIAKASISNE